ncbi:glutamine--fructose-6-phosphate aminotransferase [Alteromonas sp. KC3]|jgi:glucosamine--fructose-6-phosphate aminotransferase (isomerizing)|uniref:glucosamine-6-phosphate deaminase NagB-II n=1 Tax=unclassified Alteromonas TaxID=2614992 RepID=UPI00192297D1|nr:MULTISPECIES: SIS domain-containing protein [unclassified Alteromonas]BCO20060.1 glutamine--fructose-6-phosphate aminotransferase [Alteromonas sp. KC3]BCO24025.1 glutamine--fructose-6-phosphate aminotransferase [Alteromonas sp. KC14]
MNLSIMAKEAREVPTVIAKQLDKNDGAIRELAATLNKLNPHLIYIIGRGSSDHAGVFGKYLFETEMGIPVCSAALSIAGIFGKQLNLNGAVAFVISQSGRSPDILKQTESAKKGGAFTVAFVNDETSPLAELADAVIPLSAGEEKAVAATKSFIATLSALLHLCARWRENDALFESLAALPESLQKVIESPNQLTANYLENTRNTIVLGRGFGYAVGREVALKLKEVLGIHAEAFSSAEFIHGPVTLVEKKLKLIALNILDESAPFHADMVGDVRARGGECLDLGFTTGTSVSDVHPRVSALLLMQRFYLDIEQIAIEWGLNPDTPPGLNKVTKTQ